MKNYNSIILNILVLSVIIISCKEKNVVEAEANNDNVYNIFFNDNGLYHIKSDSSDYRLISDKVAGKFLISANGEKIAFEGFGGGHPTRKTVYLMNSDGTNIIEVSQVYNSSIGCFSPDGFKILYVSDQIYSFDIRNSTRKQLALGYSPSFSQNRKIIYSSNDTLYKMDEDGTNKMIIRRFESGVWWPKCLPNSNKIVFATHEGGTLCIIDIDGNNYMQLTDNNISLYGLNEIFSFSRDGKKIVFSALFNGGGASQIYTIDIEGSNLKQITSDERGFESPDISNYNDKVICESWGNNVDIYIIDLNSSNTKKLIKGFYPRFFP